MTAVRARSARTASARAATATANGRGAPATSRRNTPTRSTPTRETPTRRTPGRTATARARSAPQRSTTPTRVVRQRATSSRDAVRQLPQEVVGPRLRVFSRRAVSLRLLIVLSCLVFFGVLFGAVGIQAERIEGQRQIDQLDRDIAEQRDRYRSLRAQVAESESPERIMAEAQELDMVEPGPIAPLVAGTPIVPTVEAPDPGGTDDPSTADAAGSDSAAQTSSTADAGGGSER